MRRYSITERLRRNRIFAPAAQRRNRGTRLSLGGDDVVAVRKKPRRHETRRPKQPFHQALAQRFLQRRSGADIATKAHLKAGQSQELTKFSATVLTIMNVTVVDDFASLNLRAARKVSGSPHTVPVQQYTHGISERRGIGSGQQ